MKKRKKEKSRECERGILNETGDKTMMSDPPTMILFTDW